MDDHLESAYEDANGGEFDTSDDLDNEDFYDDCDKCGEPIDYCLGHGNLG